MYLLESVSSSTDKPSLGYGHKVLQRILFFFFLLNNNAYLSRADEILGIQVRVFGRRAGYFQHVMDRILACTQRVPEAAEESQMMNISKLKAVLVTSLHPEYSDNLKSIFLERPS
ncbi:unnamed protein product [Brassica rapa]|uniref:Fucosyltransferase n=1 Tax=Brassica campestris TaxID=3711 RepID=A0A3P6BPN9_BRACM|nr:unnamed protein product [Brassica rapa]VDD07593.1 unnamed protein product [Brassica rapa]